MRCDRYPCPPDDSHGACSRTALVEHSSTMTTNVRAGRSSRFMTHDIPSASVRRKLACTQGDFAANGNGPALSKIESTRMTQLGSKVANCRFSLSARSRQSKRNSFRVPMMSRGRRCVHSAIATHCACRLAADIAELQCIPIIRAGCASAWTSVYAKRS